MSYHSSLARTCHSADSPAASKESDSIDYYQFNGDEWTAANPRNRQVTQPRDCDLKIVDESPYEYSEDDLRNAKSTAARLTALEKIASSGTDRFSFRDKDGIEREFRVETSKCGDKTLIHCYGKDESGHEQVVMRFARDANGELCPEQDKNGKNVSYYGDNWTRTMQGKTLIIGEKHSRAEERSTPHDSRRESRRESSHCEDTRDHERERNYDRAEHCREANNNAPKFDMGKALANGVIALAPLLMARLSNRRHCDDYHPYREYPRYLPQRDCGNYYDTYHRPGHGNWSFKNWNRDFCR